MKLKELNFSMLIFFGALIIETLSYTFFLNRYPLLNPFILLVSSTLVCYFAFRISQNQGEKNQRIIPNKYQVILLEMVFLLLTLGILKWCQNIFIEIPNNPNSSDIVPSLELYVKRFLNFEYPYQPMNFGFWTVQPTYFPLRWLPFIITEKLKVDYRYLPIFFILFLITVFRAKDYLKSTLNISFIFKSIIPYAYIILVFIYLKIDFALSVELLIVCYHFIFIHLFENNKKPIYIAIGITLCILSRSTMVFWLIFYFYYYWIQYKRTEWFKLTAFTILLCSFIFGPYLWYDFNQSLLNGLNYNDIAVRDMWNVQSWQQVSDIPHHLNHGLNFSIYSYKYFYPDVERAFLCMKYVQLFLVILVPILYSVAFYKFKTKIKNHNFMLLISLKLYLILFYSFFYAPFPYLFFLPFFLNILIVNRVLRK